MKLGRIVKRMEALLSAKQRKRGRQVEEIKDLLQQLRKKQRKLKREALEVEDPGMAKVVKGKLEVVRAQRCKAMDALKSLRKA